MLLRTRPEKDKPECVKSMVIILQKVAEKTSDAAQDQLEKYLPYSMVSLAYVDAFRRSRLTQVQPLVNQGSEEELA